MIDMTYDPEADAIYIYLGKGKVDRTEETGPFIYDVDESGRVMSRGSVLTVGLFVALLVIKIGIGVLAYMYGINDGSSFPQVMVIVAIMIAVQSVIVRRRADALRAATSATQVRAAV